MKKMRKTTDDGHRLTMNSHPRLAFKLDEYQRRYDLVLANMKRGQGRCAAGAQPREHHLPHWIRDAGILRLPLPDRGPGRAADPRRAAPRVDQRARVLLARPHRGSARPRAPGQYDGADSRAARARAQRSSGSRRTGGSSPSRSTSRCRAFCRKLASSMPPIRSRRLA